jgi:hypothetical protein
MTYTEIRTDAEKHPQEGGTVVGRVVLGPELNGLLERLQRAHKAAKRGHLNKVSAIHVFMAEGAAGVEQIIEQYEAAARLPDR